MPVLVDNPYWFSCDELFSLEGTTYELNRGRSYTRRHLVVVKDKYMGPVSVNLCPLLPKPGTLYTGPSEGNLPLEADANVLLVKQTAKRRSDAAEDWPYWITTSEYSNNVPVRTNDTSGQHPEQDDPVVEWDYETAQEVKLQDLRGSAYLLTNKLPYSPAYTREVDYPVLSITRNELNYTFQSAAQYARALNDASYLNTPKGCIQLYMPKGRQKTKGSLRYWSVSYRLRFRVKTDFDPGADNNGYSRTLFGYYIDEFDKLFPPNPNGAFPPIGGWTPATLPPPDTVVYTDSWQPTLLQAGTHRSYVAGVDDVSLKGSPIQIFLSTNQPTHKPIPLDPAGQQLKFLDNGKQPTTWKRHEDFRYVDVNKLLVKGVG